MSPDKMACSNCKHCFQQVAVVTVSIAFTRLLWYHKVVNLLAKASLIHIVICRFISFLEERTSISCSMHTFAPGIYIQLQQWQMNKHVDRSKSLLMLCLVIQWPATIQLSLFVLCQCDCPQRLPCETYRFSVLCYLQHTNATLGI